MSALIIPSRMPELTHGIHGDADGQQRKPYSDGHNDPLDEIPHSRLQHLLRDVICTFLGAGAIVAQELGAGSDLTLAEPTAANPAPASPTRGQAADLSIRKPHESRESDTVGACVFEGSTTDSKLPTDEGLSRVA